MTPFALVAIFALPTRAAEPSAFPTPVAVEFKKASEGSIAERLERMSASMLGVKYKLGPLGEGPEGEFDSDPLVRFDAVDCMTYVEESLALARAKDQASMMDELRRIRYRDGVIEYQSRNHFTDADWLPNNIKAGFIRDITPDVAGPDLAVATKLISKRAWYAAKTVKDLKGPRISSLTPEEKSALVERWRALGQDLPDENVALNYLPIGALAAHADDIPSGTIVSLVRADDPAHETLVSHMGLIVRLDGKAFFREASSDQGKVVDVPLLDYFKIYRNAKWPLIGLNLAAPDEP